MIEDTATQFTKMSKLLQVLTFERKRDIGFILFKIYKTPLFTGNKDDIGEKN